MGYASRALLCTMVAVGLLDHSTAAFSADKNRGRVNRVAPVFRSLVPRVAGARIPVYLPSWVPSSILKPYPPRTEAQGQVHAVVDLHPGTWYSAALSIDPHVACKACARFTISGGYPRPKLAQLYHHRVFLDGGGYGVVFGGKDALWWQRTFTWQIQGRNYQMHYRCTAKEYGRVARSVVRVH